MARSTISGKHIKGSVQKFESFPDFTVNLHTERQIKSIESIRCSHRVLHIDATGGFVRMDKQMGDYSWIYNYSFLLKSHSEPEIEALPLAEVAISRHDTFSVSEMCRLSKFNYTKIIPNKKLSFRLIVLDYSFACIHATLDAFNSDSIIDYMKKVYDISIKKNLFVSMNVAGWNVLPIHWTVLQSKWETKIVSKRKIEMGLSFYLWIPQNYLRQ